MALREALLFSPGPSRWNGDWWVDLGTPRGLQRGLLLSGCVVMSLVLCYLSSPAAASSALLSRPTSRVPVAGGDPT